MKTIKLIGMVLVAFVFFLASLETIHGQLLIPQIGITNDNKSALRVAISGDYAYLANGTDGLRVYAITNPGAPLNVAHAITNGGNATSLGISGNTLYLANGSDGLRIYDISTPTNPVSLSVVRDGFSIIDVALLDHYAYIARSQGAFHIYDIADPANPLAVNQNSNFVATRIFISSNYAYMVNGNVLIANVGNPTNPLTVSTINGIGTVNSVAVADNRAYFGTSLGGVRIYDVSNPTNPVSTATITNSGARSALSISGRYLYLGCDASHGLSVYDVSDPTASFLAAFATNSSAGAGYGPVVSGNKIFWPDNFGGLRVLALTPGLKAAATNTKSLQLTWPAPAAFVVQQSTNPAASNWFTLTNVPIAIGTSNQVTITATAGNHFFRLKAAKDH